MKTPDWNRVLMHLRMKEVRHPQSVCYTWKEIAGRSQVYEWPFLRATIKDNALYIGDNIVHQYWRIQWESDRWWIVLFNRQGVTVETHRETFALATMITVSKGQATPLLCEIMVSVQEALLEQGIK